MEKKKLLLFLRKIYLLFLISIFITIDSVNANTNQDYTNIDNIYNSYFKINANNENKEKIYKNKIFVFISFSMPDNLLKEYFIEANKYQKQNNENIIFVLRGLYKNSFRETQKKVYELTKDNKDNYKNTGIIIDPELFKKYNILVVPTILKINQNDYDKITGNISIKYALKQFLEGRNDED